MAIQDIWVSLHTKNKLTTRDLLYNIKVLASETKRMRVMYINDRYYTSIYSHVCLMLTPFLFRNKDKKFQNV